MFQQARTLRRIISTLMPSASEPRRKAALLGLGGTAQGAMPRRRSILSNQDARSASPKPASLYSSAQWARVAAGVRKLDVQCTVVLPPTQRPCRMLIARSLVLRAADS